MSISNVPKWYYIIAINSYFFHLALKFHDSFKLPWTYLVDSF